ncbi:hypothetical protein C0J52_06689 [Blattella germanica]|nr:hypothetical protein C0J52_06689 [Blattella germanica]
MILQAIAVTITLAAIGGAASVPIEETDLQLTASDTDTGNWTANLGNMKINIEHNHDSSDNINGTWTLGIARTSYDKEEEATSHENEDKKEEKLQNTDYTDVMNMPQEFFNHHQMDDYNPDSRENNEIPVDEMPIKGYAPDYPNFVPPQAMRFPILPYRMYPPPPPPPMELLPPFRIPYMDLQPPVQDYVTEDSLSEEIVTDPDEFEHFHGVGWFKLDARALEWEEARKACEAVGAHLAVPDSQTRVQVFLELFKRHPEIPTNAILRDQVYVGVSDPERNREFTTVQGKPFNPGFPIWFVNEPDNNSPGEYCVTFHMEGRTRDVPCSFPLPFFCEKDVPMAL